MEIIEANIRSNIGEVIKSNIIQEKEKFFKEQEKVEPKVEEKVEEVEIKEEEVVEEKEEKKENLFNKNKKKK